MYSDLELMIKYGKACDNIAGFTSAPFINLPYGIVKKDLPALLNSGQETAAIELLMKCQHPEFDIEAASGNEIVAFLLWVKQQHEFIISIEQKYLSSEPKAEMMAAGLHKLNEFGEMITIDALAQGDILKYDEIEALPYFKVYQKLKLDKAHREIEEKYNEIMQQKNKR